VFSRVDDGYRSLCDWSFGVEMKQTVLTQRFAFTMALVLLWMALCNYHGVSAWVDWAGCLVIGFCGVWLFKG
jgi:hypothetical protein